MLESVNYSRFCVLVKMFPQAAIVKSKFPFIFKLRASYETSKYLKTEGNENEEEDYRKRDHLGLD